MEFSRQKSGMGSHSLLKGSSQSRDWTQISESLAPQADSVPSEPPGKPGCHRILVPMRRLRLRGPWLAWSPEAAFLQSWDRSSAPSGPRALLQVQLYPWLWVLALQQLRPQSSAAGPPWAPLRPGDPVPLPPWEQNSPPPSPIGVAIMLSSS